MSSEQAASRARPRCSRSCDRRLPCGPSRWPPRLRRRRRRHARTGEIDQRRGPGPGPDRAAARRRQVLRLPEAGLRLPLQRAPGGRRRSRRGADGPWIDQEAGTWNAEEKVEVPGQVDWPTRKFVVGEGGEQRGFSGNDLPRPPDRRVPDPRRLRGLPVRPQPERDRRAGDLPRDPVQSDRRPPSRPAWAARPACCSPASRSSTRFDADGRDAVAHEVQDSCNGHPQVQGAYHYHSQSACVDRQRARRGPLAAGRLRARRLRHLRPPRRGRRGAHQRATSTSATATPTRSSGTASRPSSSTTTRPTSSPTSSAASAASPRR